MLPEYAEKVLEVGCGSGETLKWLKETGRCSYTTGIELFPEAANIASSHLDKVFIGSIEHHQTSLMKQNIKFDLILFLDVLEHLVDPWTNFQLIVDNNLKDGGSVIVSLPNVRNHICIKELVLGGDWRYQDAGVLDKTHLRFFTRKTATDLIQNAGIKIQEFSRYPCDFSVKQKLFSRFTGNLFADFLAQQFIFKGVKC